MLTSAKRRFRQASIIPRPGQRVAAGHGVGLTGRDAKAIKPQAVFPHPENKPDSEAVLKTERRLFIHPLLRRISQESLRLLPPGHKYLDR